MSVANIGSAIYILTAYDMRIVGRREDLLLVAVAALNGVHVIRLISCARYISGELCGLAGFGSTTREGPYSVARAAAGQRFPHACASLSDESIPIYEHICTRHEQQATVKTYVSIRNFGSQPVINEPESIA